MFPPLSYGPRTPPEESCTIYLVYVKHELLSVNNMDEQKWDKFLQEKALEATKQKAEKR
jgi:hypothetical protein